MKKNIEKKEMFDENKLEKTTLLRGIHNALSKIDKNLPVFINEFPRPSSVNYVYPGILNGGEWDDWTSGFWTGILWLAYEITKDEKYKKVANFHLKSFKERIDNNIAVDHHDLGFLYIPSVVSNYKITNSEVAKQAGIKAADKLMSRYREKGKFIQAWGELDNPNDYRLIIDCNLNVPLLFWAYEVTKDKKYKDVAINHLNTAYNHLVRDNGTTYHTFFFDLEGNPLKGVTAQGKSDSSTWARGQAWAVYGFALAYRHTKDEKFKKVYHEVLNVFLNKLNNDYTCYWDMDFTDKDNEEKDTSSLAIAICGILEMDKYLDDNDENKVMYLNAAYNMMNELILNYNTNDLEYANGLLKEAVYSKPHNNGIEESCIWGDYFYMEAFVRMLKPDWNIYW